MNSAVETLPAKPVRRLPALFKATLCAVAGALLAGCASAPPQRSGPVVKDDYQHLAQVLDWRVAGAMKQAAVPGVAVAVVDDQRVLWSRGWGLTEAGGTVAVDADTCFRVGSVSKLFTATAVMRLVERGELQLDTPVSALLPGFSMRSAFDGPPVTVRSLLSHHGGLPGNRLRGMWEAQADTLPQLQKQLASEALVAPPQSRYEYSNVGYAMLGRIVEQRGGQPFAAAMRQELLQPLNMTGARFDGAAHLPVGCAQGHRKGRPLAPFGLRDEPAGALSASATEMAKFLQFMLADGRAGGQALLGPAAVQSMFTPQFEGLPLDFGHRVGLGWLLSGTRVVGASGPVAWHAGLYPGYHAAVVVSRADRLAAVVLANAEEASAFTVQVASEALALALEAKTGRAQPAATAARPALKAQPDSAGLAALAGDYAVFGTRTRIDARATRLATRLFDNDLDLVPTEDGRYALQKGVLGLVDVTLPDLFLRFTTVQGRRYAVLEGLPAPFAFERLEPRPIPAAWLARQGHYVADAGDNAITFKRFELTAADGVLLARVLTDNRVAGKTDTAGEIVLEPLSEHMARIVGSAAMDGGMLQAERRDGRDVLTYSGYVLTRTGP